VVRFGGVQLGVSVETQEGMRYGDVLEVVRAAEAAGLQTALLAEHYVPSGPADRYPGGFRGTMSPDAWVYLAALARDTGRIRLGTLVSPVTFRHPSVLAKMAATLDHVSGGRAELGIGAGWLEAEHAAYGFPFPDGPRRVDLVEEQLQVITGLWTRDPFSHQGTHYQLADCHFTPAPEQRPHPPILVGGQAASKRLPRLAARYATDYVLTFASAEQCRAVRSMLDDLCRANGRDPASLRLVLFTAVCVGATTAEADARLEELRATNPQYGRMLQHLPTWLMGTPEEVAEQVRRLEMAGVERVLLAVNSDLHRRMVPLLGKAAAG
jgi:alkanesulfonate monooxygenase SsuD/methylene tetrahydromethanopterin reductase-like flavin-dependent oxidoreductase (luciferase family)